jgi:hypothetical protein
MLRLKKENIGKVINKGGNSYELTSSMEQTKLEWIKKFIDANLVEDYKEEVISNDEIVSDEEIKQKSKRK